MCVIVNLRPPDLSQQFLYKIGSDSRMINYERWFDGIIDIACREYRIRQG